MRQGIRGARPQTEFVGGVNRRQSNSQIHSVKTKAGPKPHVDLRVIRKVNYKFDPERDGWRDALDEFGAKNRHLGFGRALGCIAMTYIPAKYMNSMVADRFPKDYSDPKKKIALFRNMNASLKAYMQVEQNNARDAQTNAVAKSHEQRFIEWRQQCVDDMFDEIGRPLMVIPPDSVVSLSGEDRDRLESYMFGPATLAVSGLALFGGRRYGIDLGDDPMAYHERRGLIDHLRIVEKLPVHKLDANWRPHATVLKLHDHLPAPTSVPVSDYIPDLLAFMPPETECHGLDGTVNTNNI